MAEKKFFAFCSLVIDGGCGRLAPVSKGSVSAYLVFVTSMWWTSSSVAWMSEMSLSVAEILFLSFGVPKGVLMLSMEAVSKSAVLSASEAVVVLAACVPCKGVLVSVGATVV